jgi:hypothetical protein
MITKTYRERSSVPQARPPTYNFDMVCGEIQILAISVNSYKYRYFVSSFEKKMVDDGAKSEIHIC